MRRLFIAAAAAVLMASPVGAQTPVKPAPKTLDGKMFCFGSNRQLNEGPDGNYILTIHMKMPGDLSKATWTGGKALIGPNATFGPSVTSGYKIDIGKDGKPMGRPRPFALSASAGRFSAGRPEPISSLRLKIEAGATVFPEMPLDEIGYGVGVASGKITTAESRPSATDVVVPAGNLGGLVRAAENNDASVLFLQNGREIGRIPVPKASLRAESEEMLAWAAKTAQAMTASKTCG